MAEEEAWSLANVEFTLLDPFQTSLPLKNSFQFQKGTRISRAKFEFAFISDFFRHVADPVKANNSFFGREEQIFDRAVKVNATCSRSRGGRSRCGI